MDKIWLILSGFCLSLGASDVETLVQQANQNFEKATQLAMQDPAKAQEHYQEVIVQYQNILDNKNIQTSALHRNLGNAYWFVGDKGRAILHYQRGLYLAPDNSDLRHNLNYVRSKISDAIEKSFWQELFSYLLAWHATPVILRMALLFLLNTLFFVTCAKLLFRKSRQLTYAGISTGILTLILTTSLLVSMNNWDNNVDGVITVSEVSPRQGNSYIYEEALSSDLHSGTEFELLEERGDWYYIRLLDHTTCWIPKVSANLISSSRK